MKYQGVIFDMDGVLVDSNDLHFRAFSQLGDELGVPFTREMLFKTVGMHNSQILPLWLGRTLPEDESRKLALRKESLYRGFAKDTLKAIPGSVELVKTLREKGFRLAVGSSGPRANVELALSRLGIADRFDAVITGDDVAHGKPDPEIFLKAGAGLKLIPPQCIVIEDAPQGVEAARRAEMAVIAITTTRPAPDLEAATHIIDRLEEVVSVLLD